jgi:4-hydroxybenzoate polyprenyltransferase
MYQDYANRSLRGYLIMIIVTSLLAFIGKYSNNTLALIIGNIISAIVSYYFSSKMKGIEYWDFYKMPPSMLLVIVTILNLIPQFLAVKLANKLKNKVKD